MDEAIRKGINKMYKQQRDIGNSHAMTVDNIVNDLLQNCLKYKIGLMETVKYKSAVPQYCSALKEIYNKSRGG